MEKRVEWFANARFGMFIHWGIYSLLERGEWVQFMEKLPDQEYEKLTKRFTAKKFNPDQWAKAAKDAGMKYVVLTTKHHDGFCLFDSKLTGYTVMNTPYGKDAVRKYADACRKAGLKVGFYYSTMDWHHPAYKNSWKTGSEIPQTYIDYFHGQVKELCTNYGKIDIMWFDGEWDHSAEQWQAKKLLELIYKAQPEIIVNGRLGHGVRDTMGDFSTPEQTIPAAAAGAAAIDVSVINNERPWESCMTMNANWGYMEGDDDWKSSMHLVHNLNRCAAGSGNFMLNIGPKADGTIPKPSLQRLKDMGAWLKRNGEAIYGTRMSGVSMNMTVGLGTQKNGVLYLNIFFWGGEEIHVNKFPKKVKSAHILSTGKKLKVRQEGERLFIHGLPKKAPDKYVTVVVVKTE